MPQKSKKMNLRFVAKLTLVSLLLASLAVGGGIIYWQHKSKPSQVVINVAPDKSTVPISSSSINKSVTNKTTSSDKSVATSSVINSSIQNPSDGSGQPPAAPNTSLFVSNHKPGQNGSPTTENSVCNTTPGASCYIEFTMGNNSVKLQTGIADGDGSVHWNNWSVSVQGFSSGSWAISAVATLNGQTRTASDSQDLIIQ